MHPDRFPIVRDAIAGHDVKGTLFDIPPDRPIGQPLRLREFKLEVVVPYVYDKFIGVRGMFPHMTRSHYSLQNIYMQILS